MGVRAVKGWHFIEEDMLLIEEVEAWIEEWLRELLGWPARYEKWLAR